MERRKEGEGEDGRKKEKKEKGRKGGKEAASLTYACRGKENLTHFQKLGVWSINIGILKNESALES